MPRLTRVERDAFAERARLGAAAARDLDPADRALLDAAHMGADPDEASRCRLAADPVARVYAPAVIERWEQIATP